MPESILFLLIGIAAGFFIGWFMPRARTSSESHSTDNGQLQVKYDLLKEEKEKESARLKDLENERLILLADKNKLEGSIEQSRVHFAELRTQLTESKEKLESALRDLTGKTEENKFLKEKLGETKQEVAEMQAKFTKEFENIANRILQENSKKFTEQNKENLSQVIDPFREKIKEFEKKVEDTYIKGTQERSTLAEQIKSLTDLNQQMREDAKGLTQALRGDTKQQGNWGEMILDKILERSGLEKGREYEVQYSTTGDDGKTIRPDVVIHLPDNKHIVLDSKVSLTAYNEWVNEPDETLKAAHMRNHLQSMRNHIKLLGEKNYFLGEGLNSPEFVLMFVPLESSFSAAVQNDIELWGYAWDKRVVIVSPSTLLASLRTIASVWKQERQNQNTLEIAKQAGNLYDKFVGFLQDMEKIEKGITAAHGAYTDAKSKLHIGKDNLVRKVERIRELGAKTSKDIPDTFNDQE